MVSIGSHSRAESTGNHHTSKPLFSSPDSTSSWSGHGDSPNARHRIQAGLAFFLFRYSYLDTVRHVSGTLVSHLQCRLLTLCFKCMLRRRTSVAGIDQFTAQSVPWERKRKKKTGNKQGKGSLAGRWKTKIKTRGLRVRSYSAHAQCDNGGSPAALTCPSDVSLSVDRKTDARIASARRI